MCIVTIGSICAFVPAAQGNTKEARLHADYDKWLNEDVLYIISPEEKEVFRKLTTVEEKERFIEQFWARRDPDPRTPENEFKIEHYRRIAYANKKFSSGMPGWMTDRGRIYIAFGPPDEVESHVSGGQYQRPFHEGGGSTAAFPFEIWRYRYLDGVGEDVELEFVDATLSGEYRLAMDAWEKEALLKVPGSGLTLAEEMGEQNRSARPYFTPGGRSYQRIKDRPFQRYETFARLHRPPEIRDANRRESVNFDINYNGLPVQVAEDYFKLDERRVLVLVTAEIENGTLSFDQAGGAPLAKISIYGGVSDITGKIVEEFESELALPLQGWFPGQGPSGRSVFQKTLQLDLRLRYKLVLVVKDLRSGKAGAVAKAIIPPPLSESQPCSSSLVISDSIERAGEFSRDDRSLRVGGVGLRRRASNVFPAGRPLGVYLEVYNLAIDRSTSAASLDVTSRVLQDGRVVAESVDELGESISSYSERRVVIIARLPSEKLGAGRYRAEVQVHSRIDNQTLLAAQDFEIVSE